MSAYSHGELVLVLDCVDVDAVADFWCAALGYRRAGDLHEPYLSLVSESGGPELLLQRVPERKQDRKNRLHLDLRTRDLEGETARLLGLGAARLTNEVVVEGGWRWHVLADPEGNELCVLQPPATHWG